MTNEMRIRITFAKTGDMRYTGHLDLHRTWERTLRRAQLPLAYSQGFNPHPKINLASALPLGFTGEAEVVDVWLEQDLPLEAVEADLKRAAPPGIDIRLIERVDDRAPTLQTVLESSEYEVTLLEAVEDLDRRVEGLLARDSLPRVRRDKPYDLRPLVLTLEPIPPDEEGHARLLLRLTAQEGATGRPEEVLDELGVDPLTARVHRRQLIFAG